MADRDARSSTLDEIQAWKSKLSEYNLLDSDQAGALDAALATARESRLQEPPPALITVLLLGASGGGKSELLNALAGSRIAVSHHIRPTTTRPTIYMHRSINAARLYEFGAELAALSNQPGALVLHDRDELRHKILIDAPDIDSYRTEHREQVLQLLPMADVALYVVTPLSYKDDIGWSTILEQRGRRAFAFVLNKWDREGKPAAPPGSPEADHDFQQLLSARGGYENARLFRTSARYWVQRRTGEIAPANDTSIPAGDQFQELEQWLSSGLSTSQIEQIQRRRRRALWGALAAAVTTANPSAASMAGCRDRMDAALRELETDGDRLLTARASTRAVAIAPLRNHLRRPVSPGLFGQFEKVLDWGTGLTRRRVRQEAPVLLPSADAAPETGRLDLSQLAARRVSVAEWELRQCGVQTTFINQRWNELVPRMDTAMSESLELAAANAASSGAGRVRRTAGIMLLVIFELLMTGLIGIAIWRLAQGFVTGQYVDLRFAMNFVALFLCIALAGHVVVSLLFPDSEAVVRREIETAVRAKWHALIGELVNTADDYLEEYERLRKEGQRLAAECHAQVNNLTRQLTHAATADFDETSRLFSEVGT